jgi:CelD/BcsL family acetyltransferase involved in cellulose biosynthesis
MTSPITSVRCAVGFESIALIEAGWSSLVIASQSSHPSLSLSVVRAAASSSASQENPLLMFLAERDLTCVAALACTSEPLPWAMGARQLRSLGDHEVYAVPLVVRDTSAEDAAELIRTALNTPPGFRRICLDQQIDRPLFEKIRDVAPDLLVDIRPAGYGSFLTIPKNEELFWQSLSSNFRRNLRKQQRRLEVSGDIRWRFLHGPECKSVDFERFLELEASGWKGASGGAILARPSALKYYRQLLNELAADGLLELHFLELNGRCVAAQVGVRIQNVLNLLKIAYDESVSKMAPGNMLLLELVRRLVARGDTREINCLTDMPWHRNWAMNKREYTAVTIYPRTFGAVAMAYAPRAVKHWLRENPYARSARTFMKSAEKTETLARGDDES